YKDVEQKTTTIIIFLILTALKTTSYHHDDDDDKITKMRLFPRRPPRVQAHPTRRTRKMIMVIICNKIQFLPPSHRTGDYEGTTPRSVNAVNPGVYRF
ncbi:hypothetical protein MMS33_27560, partial [Escherichia coli]|nr:hypothetical protein [Escherichia coli]